MTQFNDKKVFPQSPTSTFRERTPTSPKIANRGMTNMAVDFSKQQRVVPAKLGATMTGTRPMNSNGRPMALDVMVGGAPDATASNRGPKVLARQKLAPEKGR
jgi:hypothetical protein